MSKEYDRHYRLVNAARIKEMRDANKDRNRKYQKAYREANKEKLKEYRIKYKLITI